VLYQVFKRPTRFWLAILLAACAIVAIFPLAAQVNPAGLPVALPVWMPAVHAHALSIPVLPFSAPVNALAFLPQVQSDPDPSGFEGTYNANGLTVTASNPFFQSLGSNGRTCATCHRPANGMSISAAAAQEIYVASQGRDPLFAPVDGANCPDLATSIQEYSVSDPNNPHSLLLNRAVFRIALPWPPQGVTAEFSITPVSDPTHCELDRNYGLVAVNPMISIYRRSLMAANLKFVTTVIPSVVPPGVTLATNPYTGQLESGNIMYDGREPNLASQATDATLGHAQAAHAPSAATVQEIVAFENGIYSAQVFDTQALNLNDLGAFGGPSTLAANQPGIATGGNTFLEYSSWANVNWFSPEWQRRASIVRGEALFNTRRFMLSNVAGINDIPAVGNNIPATCSTCHSNKNVGNDVQPNAQIDEGTTNEAFALPAPDLPLFKLTCSAGKSTSFNGSTVYVRDPGKALITGKCADIGKIKSAQLRALSSRAPYFHDGSAATLADVLTFYNKRFDIKFTAQEEQDLISFLNTL